jgi:hypothetical protein
MGWLLGPTPVPAVRGVSSSSFAFEAPRAAAAHDKSVVKEARSAASLSSREGDMKFSL